MTDAQSARSVLIVECSNDDCRQVGDIDSLHNDSGRREWTTGFHVEGSDEGTNYWAPDEGEQALRCPGCGEIGTVIAY